MSNQRQIRWLEKAIDELIKIHDDGKGTAATSHILDELNYEITQMDATEDE